MSDEITNHFCEHMPLSGNRRFEIWQVAGAALLYKVTPKQRQFVSQIKFCPWCGERFEEEQPDESQETVS